MREVLYKREVSDKAKGAAYREQFLLKLKNFKKMYRTRNRVSYKYVKYIFSSIHRGSKYEESFIWGGSAPRSKSLPF